uniref:Uncharacterized protein n=1 Tax=Solanum lycopersicum TaxID=4081 RepID=A0A3Q7J9Q8_SOLLC
MGEQQHQQPAIFLAPPSIIFSFPAAPTMTSNSMEMDNVYEIRGSSSDAGVFSSDLKEFASLIEGRAYTSEVQKIYMAMRLTMELRSKIKASILSAFLNYVFPSGSEFHTRLSSYLPHGKACSSVSIVLQKSKYSITVDVLASGLYFYYSLSFELADDLSYIQGNFSLPTITCLLYTRVPQYTIISLVRLWILRSWDYRITLTCKSPYNMILHINSISKEVRLSPMNR